MLEQHVEPAGIRGVPFSLSTRSRNASKARVFLAFGVFERDAVAKEAGTVRDRTSGSGRSVQSGRECDAANRWVDRAERWRAASDSRWSSVARRINAKPACRKSAAWRANSRLRRWYPSAVLLTIIAFLLVAHVQRTFFVSGGAEKTLRSAPPRSLGDALPPRCRRRRAALAPAPCRTPNRDGASDRF